MILQGLSIILWSKMYLIVGLKVSLLQIRYLPLISVHQIWSYNLQVIILAKHKEKNEGETGINL